MSEVLGDSDPRREPGDGDMNDLFADDYDDLSGEIDDGFRKPMVLPPALRPMVEPSALAIVSLVLGALSLMGQLVGGTVMEALSVARLDTASLASSNLYTTRVAAIVSLVLACIAAACGLGAASATARAEDPAAHKNSRAMAGAGITLALLSIIISVVALVILSTVHIDNNPLGF